MHAKSAEVTQFLERDLLPQVKEAFAQYQPADKAAIEKELSQAIEQARGLGADPEGLPKVKELRARLARDAVVRCSGEGAACEPNLPQWKECLAVSSVNRRRIAEEG